MSQEDRIRKELDLLERTIANPEIPLNQKIGAILKVEHLLAKERGATLRIVQEVERLLSDQKLDPRIRSKELSALEAVFVEAYEISMGKMHEPKAAREKLRQWFRRLVSEKRKMLSSAKARVPKPRTKTRKIRKPRPL